MMNVTSIGNNNIIMIIMIAIVFQIATTLINLDWVGSGLTKTPQ